MKEKIYTSDEILKTDDLYDVQEMICSSGLEIKYQMTDDEIGWLKFIQDKYSIADYFLTTINNDGIVIINSDASIAMDADNYGAGKAVMLSDETALQKILFWIYTETE